VLPLSVCQPLSSFQTYFARSARSLSYLSSHIGRSAINFPLPIYINQCVRATTVVMSPRKSSGHGLPSSSVVGIPPAEKGQASEEGLKSDKSKNGNGKKDTTSNIDVPTTGQQGGEISPTETTGSLPSTFSIDSLTGDIVKGVESGFRHTEVLPMGFTNSSAPKYPTNVCYRNSVISMLLNIPMLSNWLETYLFKQDILEIAGEAPPNDPSAPILQSLARLSRLYWRPKKELAGKGTNKQEQLNEAMDVFFKRFVNTWQDFNTEGPNNHWSQEDADDFLGKLVGSMEEELSLYVK
jgi:Ubiquitin carboxyl-terminal hydrolase